MSDEDTERVDVDASIDGEQPQPELQSINRAQFRANVRQLIDLANASGMDEDAVQAELEDLAVGVPYFYEDVQRYTE